MTRAAPKRPENGKNRIFGALKFALIIILGLLAGRLVTFFIGGGSAENPDVGALVVIPAIFVAVLVVLALHEAGHVVGGKLTGARFALFIVGPLKLQATKDGVRLGLNRSLALAGGIAGTVPTNAENLRLKMAVMTAGGPVMSFVIAGAAFALGRYLDGGFAGVLSQAVAAMSLIIGIITLLPVKNGEFFTDGRRLIMLLRGGPEAERWCAISALGGASMAGVRPRDWDEELIQKSLSPADGSLDEAGAALTALHHALDLGDVEKARVLLQRALEAEDTPEIIRSQTLLEAAFFFAAFDGDPEKARGLYSRTKPGSALEKSLPLRAEAAILLREGEFERAKDAARRALNELRNSMSPGSARLEREWLEELEGGRFPDSPLAPESRDDGR